MPRLLLYPIACAVLFAISGCDALDDGSKVRKSSVTVGSEQYEVIEVYDEFSGIVLHKNVIVNGRGYNCEKTPCKQKVIDVLNQVTPVDDSFGGH